MLVLSINYIAPIPLYLSTVILNYTYTGGILCSYERKRANVSVRE